ncbi:MAG: thioredoxin TrxC [Acidobacteriota bacterium]
MAGEIIACSQCGQSNRVPSLSEGKAALCGKCRAPLGSPTAEPITATDSDFASLISAGEPVVVDFWAPWCGPCRQFAPVFEAVAEERKGIRFAKLNVDENQRTAARYQVSSIPTLLFFNEGEVVGRQVGAVGRSQFDQVIDRYLGQ